MTTNPGTGRGGKMPGMICPRSLNYAPYKDGTESEQAEGEGDGAEMQERQGDPGHGCLGKGPVPAIYLCPI